MARNMYNKKIAMDYKYKLPAMDGSPSTARPPLRTPPVTCNRAPTKT